MLVEDLREYGIGEWEGMSFTKLAEDHQFVDRATADPTLPRRAVNPCVQWRVASSPAIRAIHASHEADERVLVVGHGVALAVALSSLLDDDPSGWTNYHFANCSLTELVLSPTPYVNFFNSTQHL